MNTQMAKHSSSSLGAASLTQQRPIQMRSAGRIAPRALFATKKAVAVEEPPAPAKRGLFGRAATTTKQQPAAAKQQKRSSMAVDKAAEYE